MGRQLAPLFFAAFLAYGYNNIFMTLTPSFVVAAGGTLAEAGLQNSVYLAAAVLLRFAFGPAADRWGTKPVMLVGLASFVLGGVLFPLCAEFWQMLLVRCVQAVGLASFWSSATATVSEAAPPQARGRWLGLYRLTTSASLLLGPLVAFGLVKAAGFAACFRVLAGCSAVALVCVGAMRLPRRHRCERLRVASPCAKGSFPLSGVVGIAVAGTFVAAMGYGLLFSFGGTFISAAGMTGNEGWCFTLIGLGGLAANPVAGILCDCRDARRLFGVHGLLMGMGVALFAVAASSLPALVVSGLCIGYGYAGAMVCAQAMIARQVAEGRQATALALQQNAIDVGIASASALYGARVLRARAFRGRAVSSTPCDDMWSSWPVRSGSRDDSKGASARKTTGSVVLQAKGRPLISTPRSHFSKEGKAGVATTLPVVFQAETTREASARSERRLTSSRPRWSPRPGRAARRCSGGSGWRPR